MRIRAVGVAALLCAGFAVAAPAQSLGPPWTLRSSPDSITLRWYPNDVGEGAAHSVASMHCAAIGRPAMLAEIEQDGSAEIGHYRCG